MLELLAVMMNNWENQFVNAKQVGREMGNFVKKHPSVMIMVNVEQMPFVNMEFVRVSKDLNEISPTCRSFALVNGNDCFSVNNFQLCSWIMRWSNMC